MNELQSLSHKRVTFCGHTAVQTFSTFYAIEQILNENPGIIRIVELGTADGGLTLFLGAQMLARNGVVLSIDKKFPPKKWLKLAKTFNIEFIESDAFKPRIIDTVRQFTMLHPSLIICDNGNKPLEMRTYVPLLKKGDLIMAHDWGDEITEEDLRFPGIERLEPYHQEMFDRLETKMVSFRCKDGSARQRNVEVSIIIPIGSSGIQAKLRRSHLEKVVECLGRQTFRSFETIIVEQKIKKTYFTGFPVDRYISLQTVINRYYNKSWCENVGVRVARGDLLVFLDGDVIFEPEYIEKLVRTQKETGWKAFAGWSKFHRVDREGHKLYSETKDIMILKDYIGKTYPKVNPWGACGGVIVMTKQFFLEEFGGFNEAFFGWGSADNEAAQRIRAILGEFYFMEHELYHLPHGIGPGRFITAPKNMSYRVAVKQNMDLMRERILEAEFGDSAGPKVIDMPGMKKVFYFNLSVGSGIERAGDTFLELLRDYNLIEYKGQNPPCIIIEELVRQKPEVIVMNEMYPRVIKAVYFYKVMNPETKVILLNHCYDRLVYLPYEDEFEKTDHDGVVLLNYFFANRVDRVINLNHHPKDKPYPDHIKDKVVDQLFPIAERFKSITPWKERERDFLYFGNLLPHKFSDEFIGKCNLQIDIYGNPNHKRDLPDNMKHKGFVPEEQLVETINQYRFYVAPHDGREPFNLCIAEAIRCGCIPLVVNDRRQRDATWIDWAKGCYIEFQSVDDLLEFMEGYLQSRDNVEKIKKWDKTSYDIATEMARRTSMKRFKVLLDSLIKGKDPVKT